VSLAGLDARLSDSLPLAALYVERPLAAASLNGPATEGPTLVQLMQAPGARVLLTAGPGFGKTMALRRLALACAVRTSDEFDSAGDLLETWPEAAPVPIMLDLRQLPPDPAAWLSSDEIRPFADELEQHLAAGECLIFADSLDARSSGALAAFAERYPACRFAAAARPGTPPPAGFKAYTLAPLDKTQINEMVARWLTALRPPDDELPDRIADLQGRLLPDPQLLELVSWPLALAVTILAACHGVSLPAARDLVYAQLVDLLLDRWPGPPGLATALGVEQLADPAARAALLHPLALRLQERAVAQPSQPPALGRAQAQELLYEALAPLGAPRSAADTLLERCLRAGLLEESDGHTVTMPFAALREHLAGDALARAAGFQERAAALCDDEHWHGTLRLALHRYDALDGDGSLATIRGILEAGQRRAAGLRHPASGYAQTLLAAACLRDLDAAQRAPDLADDLRQRLMALLGESALPLPERIRAGLLLGEIGDPRFDDLMPPTAFVEGGVFILGANVASFEDEGPPQRIDVPAFRIGIYPVTNREYARFLAAEPQHPRPRYWYDPRFNNPSLPVVGVTWHDAVAYCNWLTGELAAAGKLPPNTVVRLPLEAEWEKAATWGPGAHRKRVYPWGDQWDQTRANTAEGRRAWLTTPVGCFPGGVSPYGVHDLIGNVWEWTASVYASYPGSMLPQHRKGHYVLRGSSCVSLATNTRATYRGSHLPPHYWRYHLGFRIVIGRPLPPRDDDAAR